MLFHFLHLECLLGTQPPPTRVPISGIIRATMPRRQHDGASNLPPGNPAFVGLG